MTPTTRFRLISGAVFFGLAAMTACGRKDEATPPRLVAPGLAAAQPQPAPPEVTGEQPGLPRLAVQADELATTGTGGHQAQVLGDPGLQYQWFIQGGAFEGDSHGQSVTWTAGAPGEVRIFCQGENASGKKTVVLARVQSVPEPTVDGFSSAPPVVTEGRSAKLSWNAKEIKTLRLDPGGVDVSQLNGPAFEVKPAATTTYTLTATNAAGTSVAKTLLVKVVPPPSILSFHAVGAVSIGQPLTLSGAFKGGIGELRRGGEVLARAGEGGIQAQITALKAGDAFALTVTNEGGSTVTRTLTFNPSVQH